MSNPTTRNLTILLTDMKGFTAKTSRKTRSDIVEMLENHSRIVLPILQSKGGNLIKTIGDAFLMVFESPTDAVLAGIAVQDALTQYNAEKAGDDRIEVRVAINLGEVTITDGDIFGEPVNITARIEGVADAGEVFFTEAVYLAMNKKEVPSSEVGLLQLKGIPEKIRVYRVKREHPVGTGTPDAPAPASEPFVPTPAPATPPAAVMFPTRASLTRRGVGLALDALFCAILVGILFDSGHRVELKKRIHLSGQSEKKLAKAPDAGVAAQGEAGSPEVKLDDNGISVRLTNVDVQLDDNGIRVTGKAERPEASPATPTHNALFDESAQDRTNDEEEPDPPSASNGSRWKIRTTETKGTLFPFVWLVYCTMFLGVLGATPGMKVLGLQLVQLPNGARVDWKHAFLRSVFSLVSGAVCLLGFLWAAWEPERRTWHDLVAGTRVVREPSSTSS